MSRRLLVAMLCVFAASAHAMTVSVAPAAQQQAGSPAVPPTADPAAKGAAPGRAADTRPGSATAASGKAAAPSAAQMAWPAAALPELGVPPRASAAQATKPGVAHTKANTFMPSAANKANVPAPVPANKAWASIARGSATMRRGKLEAMNVSAGTFKVFGQKLNFNAQRVKVFNRDGRPASIYTVKSGTSVRFTLDPTDPAQRRVAVIYVD